MDIQHILLVKWEIKRKLYELKLQRQLKCLRTH